MSPLVNGRLPQANPYEQPAKKVPLYLQLQHARHELHLIQSHDAVGTARPKARASEGKALADRQAAIIATLEWLQSIDREELRAFVEQRRAAAPAEGDSA